MPQQAMQPIELVEGQPRFKENKIIRYLMMRGKVDLNEIDSMIHSGMISNEDYFQLKQLMGCSVVHFGELSDVPPELLEKAERTAAVLTCTHEDGLYGDPEYGTTFCEKCQGHVCPNCKKPMPEDQKTRTRCEECDIKAKDA